MAKKSARESILQEKTVKSPKVKVVSDERVKTLKTVSIISIVIAILICIVFNVLADRVLDKSLTFDSTSVHINTVGTYTKSFLKQLNKKVEIYGLFNKNDSSPEWRDYFIPIIDDYEAKADGKISVSYIDPDVNPFIITELDPDGLYGVEKYSYVIKCGDKIATVYPYTCFDYNQYYYSQYGWGVIEGNNVESTITGYLSYVTSDISLHAYYLTGHSEDEAHSYLDSILISQGMATSTLNLSGGKKAIPEDCDLILILQPMQDITEAESDLLKLYLQNGGKMVVVNDFKSNQAVDYKNLSSLCKQMGISMENGLIREKDPTYLMQADDPYTSWAVSNTEAEQRFNGKFYSSYNRYLSVYYDKSDNVSVYPLLTTSESASVEYMNLNISESVSGSAYPVVLEGRMNSSGDSEGIMLFFATQCFTSNEYYSEKSLSDDNASFARYYIGNLCEIQIDGSMIPAKTVPNYSLRSPISSNNVTLISVVVMTVIPIGCLICGVYIYRKRRHL